MRFHATDTLRRPGRDSEERVWHALQKGFRNRPGEAIWHFPIFSAIRNIRKEPDIVILDREFGILVIEVKGFLISHIESISAHCWHLTGIKDQDKVWPFKQAEDAAWALKNVAERMTELIGEVPLKVTIALPRISRKQWEEKGLGGAADPSPAIIFSDDLSDILPRIRSIRFLTQQGSPMTDDQFELFKNIILGPQKSAIAQIWPTGNSGHKSTSRIQALDQASEFLHEADIDQMRISMEIPPGFQQIRGIAGSGKTLLLCQKAATMHLKCPDWKIALIFFTQSLYEHVRDLLDTALRHQSQGDASLETAEKSGGLHVFHAWGSKERDGFYRLVAKEWQQQPQPTISDISPGAGLAIRCRELLKKANIRKQIFDAILIDEAQDLVSDEKIDGQQPFFALAYHALKPIETNAKERRLIWAYDEAQSLDSPIVPKAKEIFGEEFANVTSGFHEGGIKRSHVMQKCYRTPGPILVGAAALGMGLLREKGMVSGLTNAKDWNHIGYKTFGDFYEGFEVSISRPEANSPNPIPRLCPKPETLAFKNFPSPCAEAEFLAESIETDLQEGILPHDIFILLPRISNRELQYDATDLIADKLRENKILFYLAGAERPNSTKGGRYHPERFRMEGCVTISYPFRAKGNEARLVYVGCLDLLEDTESDPASRNQIFVCMSRSKGWCQLTASFSSESTLKSEIEKVVKTSLSVNPTFHLKYKKPKRFLDHEESQLELPSILA